MKCYVIVTLKNKDVDDLKIIKMIALHTLNHTQALKTKHDTPKYGLIYHASLVGQASTKMKGKVSRMLAAKAALACRLVY